MYYKIMLIRRLKPFFIWDRSFLYFYERFYVSYRILAWDSLTRVSYLTLCYRFYF